MLVLIVGQSLLPTGTCIGEAESLSSRLTGFNHRLQNTQAEADFMTLRHPKLPRIRHTKNPIYSLYSRLPHLLAPGPPSRVMEYGQCQESPCPRRCGWDAAS